MKKHSTQRLHANTLLLLGFALCVSLCLAPSRAHAGTAAGINGRILITNITGGAYHFSSIKPDGTDFKDVLVDSVSKYDVEYSPDGTQIAYVQSISSIPQVFIANADGSSPHQVTTSTGIKYTPSWSPDGTKLLYSQAVSSQVHIFRSNTDGSNETEITSTGVYYNPVYSPDATKIIATFDSTDDEIYIMDADGSNVVNLTNNSVEDRKASWSPDGTKIVYSSGVSGFFEIFTMSPNGSNKTQLTSSGEGNVGAVYSPDGTKIAFRDNLAPSLIHVMNADGTGEERYPYGWARELTWQPLTHTPHSATSNPTIAISGGKASINIPSLYTDTYEGMDVSSVTITSQPSLGTVSVNATTGVVTYTQKSTAHRSIIQSLAQILIPHVHAAATDNFSYRVCSLSSGSLCATGTVSVNLLAAPRTGIGSVHKISPLLGWLLGGLAVTTGGLGTYFLKARRTVRSR